VTCRGRWRRGETVGSEKIRGEGRRREGQGAGGGRTGSPRGRRRRRGRPSFAERAAESIGSAIPRSKGGEQRPPVEIDYKKEPMPQALRGSPSPPGPTSPSPRSASIRRRRTSRAGRSMGSDRARRPQHSPPPSRRDPSRAGSVHSRIRPRCRRCPPILRAESKVGGALKRSEAALLPQGRQHPRRGPACIRSRRTSRAARPGRLPRRRRRRKAEPPSSSRPRHKCARSRSSAVGVGAILARRLIKG
jgi:hypothetical protein